MIATDVTPLATVRSATPLLTSDKWTSTLPGVSVYLPTSTTLLRPASSVRSAVSPATLLLFALPVNPTTTSDLISYVTPPVCLGSLPTTIHGPVRSVPTTATVAMPTEIVYPAVPYTTFEC